MGKIWPITFDFLLWTLMWCMMWNVVNYKMKMMTYFTVEMPSLVTWYILDLLEDRMVIWYSNVHLIIYIFKGIVHPNVNSVIIYSLSSHSTYAVLFFLWNTKGEFLKNFIQREFLHRSFLYNTDIIFGWIISLTECTSHMIWSDSFSENFFMK